MNTFVHHNKSTFLSLVSTVFMSLVLLMGIQACSSSSSPSAPIITLADVAVIEGDSGTTDLVFTATLDKTSTSAITFTFTTADGTAEVATDYAVATGTAEIIAGATNTTITVTLNGDTDIEPDETLSLSLSSPVGATLAATSVTGTITSDDHADPSAYYTGTATVINPNDLTGDLLSLADLRVMISGTRIMMMNTVDRDGDKTVLYDAQITNINGANFTADVTIYVNMHEGVPGEKIQSTLTGTINENSGIVGGVIGTANDTKAGTGTFEVLFNEMSNTPAASANIEKRWNGPMNGLSFIDLDNPGMFLTFMLNGQGEISTSPSLSLDEGMFDGCNPSGTVRPINATESLYVVDLVLSSCQNIESNGTYTGFAIPTSQTNDTLVIAFSNARASGISFLAFSPL